VLVIEDNLCNNYCNISLNRMCRDFLYKWTSSYMHVGGGENLDKTIFKEKISRQPRKKQNPKPNFFYQTKRSQHSHLHLPCRTKNLPSLAFAKQTRESSLTQNTTSLSFPSLSPKPVCSDRPPLFFLIFPPLLHSLLPSSFAAAFPSKLWDPALSLSQPSLPLP